ncbi:MAG TPA: TetR/AcrR family transcriptional regulator [Acidimicrobiales bacterium]
MARGIQTSTQTSTRGTPTKGEQTRRAILDAAIARFGRDGYRATSVADIARDAKVGGTAPYAYFPNKEALFVAALDEDAAAVIEEGLTSVIADPDILAWRETVITKVVAVVRRHPLARRVLAGLEPDVTERIVDIPALAELRKTCAERLAAEQLAGTVRRDIDPAPVANGIVVILLSLLRAVVQLGDSVVDLYKSDVAAVFAAALDPPADTA